MPVNTQIDPYSFTSIKVRPYFNDRCCSEAATAFCYVSDYGQHYLITNWHVVSGRNSETGINLDQRTAMRPNILRILPHRSGGSEEISVSLYEEEAPRWLIHPVNGWLVDVVALPIEDVARHQWQPINRLQQSPLPIVESDDVFILGFPDGLTGGINFPIWKRGTVSSLPTVDQDSLPYFIIDAMTGHGMSGSPVLRRDRLPPDMLNVQYVPGTNQPRGRAHPTRFVGVYSGRIGETGVKATLGRVWRADVVDEILRGQTRDRS